MRIAPSDPDVARPALGGSTWRAGSAKPARMAGSESRRRSSTVIRWDRLAHLRRRLISRGNVPSALRQPRREPCTASGSRACAHVERTGANVAPGGLRAGELHRKGQ